MTDINQDKNQEPKGTQEDNKPTSTSAPQKEVASQEPTPVSPPDASSAADTNQTLEPALLVENTKPEAEEAIITTTREATTSEPLPPTPSSSGSKNDTVVIDEVDHHSLSKAQLVERFAKLIHSYELGQLKGEVELIRAAFFIKHNQEQEVSKKAFIAEGGLESDFQPIKDQYEQEFKELMSEYKAKKEAYFKQVELQKEKNLKEKYAVIEGIKDLINKDESIAKTFDEFRCLQERWRNSGVIPPAEAKNLWETYHHHVENFYDFIKINKELRDLDLKKNLEQKEVLCQRAEALQDSDKPISAFNELQHLHSQWREIGPVDKQIREQLWTRFKAASSIINKKNQQHYDQLREEQKNNLAAKVDICETLEALNERPCQTAKEWNKRSNEVIKLQTLWKEIRYIPRAQSDKIYRRFRAACDIFFNSKRDFYKKYKDEQEKNLEKKKVLCKQVEEMKDSDNWSEATDFFISIQKEWKKIGPVSRKQSDAIWEQFRGACNHFFDRKNQFFASGNDKHQDEHLEQKLALLEELKEYTVAEDLETNKIAIKEFKKRWSKIGHVPQSKKEELNNNFRHAIANIFAQLNLDEAEQSKQLYIAKLEDLVEGSNTHKLDLERSKVINKMKTLEADIHVWENNIGFFSSTKEASALVSDFVSKIETGKEKLIELKGKLRLIEEVLRQLF